MSLANSTKTGLMSRLKMVLYLSLPTLYLVVWQDTSSVDNTKTHKVHEHYFLP